MFLISSFKDCGSDFNPINTAELQNIGLIIINILLLLLIVIILITHLKIRQIGLYPQDYEQVLNNHYLLFSIGMVQRQLLR